jgi:hypothetical protein
MGRKLSFRRARSVLSAEVNSIRQGHPDLDAGDIAGFTVPIMLRAVGLVAVGVVPLLVVRNSPVENAELVPIIASLALVMICAAVVSWLLAIVISGLVVMVLYQLRPATSSQLVMRALNESFIRIEGSTSLLMLVALLAGLISLALGLPARSADYLANPVLDDLLAAQIGVFIAALGLAFIAESIRSAADIVDDQSLLLAWPWSLVIASVSWVIATVAGPFEATRMLTILLRDWLPATIDGVPRAQLIADLVPLDARWWVAFGALPVIAVIWAYQAHRLGGFTHVRQFLSEDDAITGAPAVDTGPS